MGLPAARSFAGALANAAAILLLSASLASATTYTYNAANSATSGNFLWNTIFPGVTFAAGDVAQINIGTVATPVYSLSGTGSVTLGGIDYNENANATFYFGYTSYSAVTLESPRAAFTFNNNGSTAFIYATKDSAHNLNDSGTAALRFFWNADCVLQDDLYVHLKSQRLPLQFIGQVSGSKKLTIDLTGSAPSGAGVFNIGGTSDVSAANTHGATTLVSTSVANLTGFQLNKVNALGTGVLTLTDAKVLLFGKDQTFGGLAGTSASQLKDNSATAGSSLATLDMPVDAAFAGTIVDGAARKIALTKTGSATQTLSGANTYSGGTILSNGTLLANNPTLTDSATGTGPVTVNGGVLGGSGSIGGVVTVNTGGNVNPAGTAVGTLTLNNNLILNTGATCTFQLGSSAGGTNDKIVVNGDLQAASPITLNIDAATLDTSIDYILMTWTGTSTPSFVTTPSYVQTPPGQTYTIVVDSTTTPKQVRLHPAVTTWAVTVSAGANGSISPSGPSVAVNNGADQLFTITPAAGYLVQAVVADGSTNLGAVSSYTFHNVTAAHSISATFVSLPSQTITASVVGIGGSISDLGATSVPARSDKTYTLTPDFGYKVQDVVIDGTTHLGSVTSYTFPFVITSHTIDVSFAFADYYWDTDGVTAGLQSGSGIWDAGSTALWNSDAAGNGSPITWLQGRLAHFATGGTNAVTLSGTIQAYSLNIATNGTIVNLSGDTLELGAGGINVAGNQNGHTIASAVTLAADQTWTLGFNLAVNGNISGPGVVTKSGAGALTLSGANDYSAGTLLSAGTLNIDSSTALGATAATFTISGGTINNNSAGALTLSNNNAENWNGDFTFTGTQDLNLGGGAVTVAGNRQVTVSAKTLAVGGIITGTGTLTKAGAGTLVLSSSGNALNNIVVAAGVFSLNDSLATPSLTLQNTTDPLDIKGTTPSLLMTSGSLTLPGRWRMAHDGGYARATITGGIINHTASYLDMGFNQGRCALTFGGTAIYNGSGRLLDMSNANSCNTLLTVQDTAQATFDTIQINSTNGGANQYGMIKVSSGSLTATSLIVGVSQNQNNGNVSLATVNQTGGAVTVNGTVTLAADNVLLNTTLGTQNLQGTYNLAGGTLSGNEVLGGGAGIGGQARFNFHGGTLAVNPAASSGQAGDFINLTQTSTDGKAYIYEGGIIDTGGKAVTINQPLLAPTGQGVASIPYSGTVTTGYSIAPAVHITRGAGDTTGTGATATAEIDPTSGAFTGITITNPGTDYTVAPSVVLDFTQGAGITPGTPTLADNSAYTGGLTKVGAGILTLTAANTYAGNTAVTQGTLLVNNTTGSGTGPGNVTVSSGATLGGTGTIGGAVAVANGGLLLANITNYASGACNDLTVASLALPVIPSFPARSAAWTVSVNADSSFTEASKTFQFLTASAGISGFSAPAVTGGPGTGTWLVRQNSTHANILELVYTPAGANPYASWSGSVGDFNLDANNDGVANGLAWMLGAADKSVSSRGLLPKAGTLAGALTLDFVCLKPSGMGATASLAVQYSIDLGLADAWHSAGVPDLPSVPGSSQTLNNVVFLVTEADSLHNHVVARIPAVGGGGKLFGRLLATGP